MLIIVLKQLMISFASFKIVDYKLVQWMGELYIIKILLLVPSEIVSMPDMLNIQNGIYLEELDNMMQL